jgi:hypothetical protein
MRRRFFMASGARFHVRLVVHSRLAVLCRDRLIGNYCVAASTRFNLFVSGGITNNTEQEKWCEDKHHTQSARFGVRIHLCGLLPSK